MKKKSALIMALLLTGIILLTILPGCGKEPIKIGVILSLTGSGQAVGTEIRDGMELALEEINVDGINGRPVELIIRDTASNADNARTAFAEIEETFHPDLYIAQHSLNSMAVADLAEASEVVLFGLVTSTPEFTEDKEWVYRYYSTAEEETRVALGICEELNVSRLEILYLDESMGHSFTQLVADALEANGEVVTSQPIAVNGADYAALVANIDPDVDAVYIPAYAAHITGLLKELRKVDFQGDIITNSGSSSPAVVTLPEAEGVYFPCPRIYSSDYPIGEQIKKKYEKLTGKMMNHYSANGYDVIKLLGNLLGDKDVNRQSVKDTLDAGFIHPGIMGTIYIEENDHEISFPLYAAQVSNGEINFRY